MVRKAKRGTCKSVKSHFRIYCGQQIALGPGKADVLKHIAQTGSISEAARQMKMSYNRAWLLVRTMNRCFKEPLVMASRGGDARGGAELTRTGKRVLALYQQLEARVLRAAKTPLDHILSRLKD